MTTATYTIQPISKADVIQRLSRGESPYSDPRLYSSIAYYFTRELAFSDIGYHFYPDYILPTRVEDMPVAALISQFSANLPARKDPDGEGYDKGVLFPLTLRTEKKEHGEKNQTIGTIFPEKHSLGVLQLCRAFDEKCLNDNKILDGEFDLEPSLFLAPFSLSEDKFKAANFVDSLSLSETTWGNYNNKQIVVDDLSSEEIAEKLTTNSADKKKLFARVEEDEKDWLTLKCGERSPVYFNIRNVCSDIKLFASIAHRISAKIMKLPKRPDRIVGVPMGSIQLAGLVSFMTNIPFLAIDKDKTIGICAPNKDVLIVEDVATSGQSALKVVSDLRKLGVRTMGVMSVLDREESAAENMKVYNVPYLYAVCKQTDILKMMKDTGKISDGFYQKALDVNQAIRTKMTGTVEIESLHKAAIPAEASVKNGTAERLRIENQR